MIKKFLIGCGLFAVIVIVLTIFWVVKSSNEIEEEITAHEPELHQYIKMTVEEQNAYAEKFEEPFENESPELKAARIEYTRARIASMILDRETLEKDLSAEERAKFQAENYDIEERYLKMMKEYDNNKNKTE